MCAGQGPPGKALPAMTNLTYLSVVNVKPMKGRCSPEKPEWEPGGSMSCTRTHTAHVRATFKQTGRKEGGTGPNGEVRSA